MVKVIDMYISHSELLEFAKTIEDCNNCKDIVITDVRTNNDDIIEIKAIVSDEIIDKKQSLRHKYS